MRLEALCALLACVLTATSSDVSPVDSLRSKLFRLEENLWKNVTDPKWNEKVELGADVELTKAFIKLNEDVEAVPKQNKPVLTDSWLWSKATEKVQIINGLYNEFLEFSKRQATPGSVPAPVKDWLDLTEHVLMDPKSSVSQAVKKLDDILEHGDLFRAVLQVYGFDILKVDTRIIITSSDNFIIMSVSATQYVMCLRSKLTTVSITRIA